MPHSHALQGNRAAKETSTASEKAIQSFTERLSSIPVEYRTDLTFSLLRDAPFSLSQQQRKELLVNLFETADSATIAAPVVNATKNYNTLSYQEVLNLSWLPYDRLDIQTRVVSLLRQRWPALSWNLLQKIKLPDQRADCSDSLTPDFRPYYEVMASSLNAIHSDITPTGQSKVEYVAEQIQKLQSPAQLKALLQSFIHLDLSNTEQALLFDDLVKALGNVNGSDREMYGAEQQGPLTDAVAATAQRMQTAHIDTSPLLGAYREFLIRYLHNKACTDATLDRNAVAADFNQIDSHQIGDAPKPVRQLTGQNLLPYGIDGAAKDEPMPEAADVREQQHRIAMIFLANGRSHSLSDSPDDYLQPAAADVNDMLRHATSEETREGMSDLGRYEDTQSTLMLLIELLPPGPSFRDAIDAEAAFLSLNPIEQSSPLSWLRCFKELIAISRPVTIDEKMKVRKEIQSGHGVIMMPSPNAQFIRDTLHRYQSDPIISIYLTYEDLFHPSYVSFKESLSRQPL